MAVFRCKMCGGDLEVQEGATSCVCEFCGTRQTLPSNQDENLQGLFNRANVLRIKSEFDKASDIYEKILQADETEAEAYWGLILCKYGIEYVEDPATYKRIPTCHRASYDAVITDEDYKNALKYADAIQREIYESEAAKIDEIQKGILTIAQKESPYDVFICYKETDESGNRTQDSVIANEIYYQLTHEGFKVFYAAISLEDKLGSEYEPVIFSALNTAKVMLVLGTKPEYFNAVWVKNEWSRFLKIMKKDRTKLMIPCYKDMDPYELPEEFAHLQAQNMSKIGFINDLVRGIQKVIGSEQQQAKTASTPIASVSPVNVNNIDALLKRGNIALDDGEWQKADGFFEDVLNQDAECAEAYWGKYLALNKQSNSQKMFESILARLPKDEIEYIVAFPLDENHVQVVVQNCTIPEYLPEEAIRNQYRFDNRYPSVTRSRSQQKDKMLTYLSSDRLLMRVRQYAKGEKKEQFEIWQKSIETAMVMRIKEAMEMDQVHAQELWNSYKLFIQRTDCQIQEQWRYASNVRESDYQNILKEYSDAKTIQDFSNVYYKLISPKMKGYKDTSELANHCRVQIDKLVEIEKKEEKKKKQKRNICLIVSIIAALIVAVMVFVSIRFIIPQTHYNAAVQNMNENKITDAFSHFSHCAGYKDSDLLVQSYFSEMDFEVASQWIKQEGIDEKTQKYLQSQIEIVQAINENKRVFSTEVGDIVTLGYWENEPLEWIVLDKNDGEAMLLCKTIVARKEYDERIDISGVFEWNKSTIREWLNNEFRNSCFTSAEISMFGSEISLMSIADVNKYKEIARPYNEGTFMLKDVNNHMFQGTNLGGVHKIENWEIATASTAIDDLRKFIDTFETGRICPLISIRSY
ncbi:MAG: toll/interleukin-1 receptor domain-containing protein [Anaerolineaceae bacterium]|nr:toll/interleukin-1 receptor domain-containing protein [Anaerolineaceae bacterium]